MKLWQHGAMHFACVAAILAVARTATADSVADFYKGKSVTLVIAERSAADMMSDIYRGKAASSFSSVQQDSPYDLTARTAVTFLHKYIPGNPDVIAQNMPGAAGSRATQYLYSEAPHDGTVLLVAAPSVVLGQLLAPSARYRAERFSWLGRIAPLTEVGFVAATAGITSIRGAKERAVVLGAEGPNGPSAMVPWALNRLAGTRFKVVRGYAGNIELFIALQRGEIQGMGSVSLNTLADNGWLTQGRVNVLYAISNSRLVSLPDVPTAVELADNERSRAMLWLLASIPDVGITIVAPPEVPAERIAALRAAFAAMVVDRTFIDSERKLEINVDPLGGKDVGAIVERIADTPPNLVEALRAAVEPMK